MADTKDHPVKPQGLVGTSISLTFKIIGILIFSAIVSIIIEWIGMAFFYETQGFEHAKSMMIKEIGYLTGEVRADQLNGDAIKSASETVSNIFNYLFVDSGVLSYLESVKNGSAEEGKIMGFIKDLIAIYYDYLVAAIFVFSMFLVRLAILALSLPAFALFGLVGVVDGLMQRDLRRWSGGIESGYIYHWAKRFSLSVLFAGWFVYLSIPNSIHPNFIITPFSVLFGLVLMVMTSKFKKYL